MVCHFISCNYAQFLLSWKKTGPTCVHALTQPSLIAVSCTMPPCFPVHHCHQPSIRPDGPERCILPAEVRFSVSSESLPLGRGGCGRKKTIADLKQRKPHNQTHTKEMRQCGQATSQSVQGWPRTRSLSCTHSLGDASVCAKHSITRRPGIATRRLESRTANLHISRVFPFSSSFSPTN